MPSPSRRGQYLAWALVLGVYPLLDGAPAAAWATAIRLAVLTVCLVAVRAGRPVRAWTWYFLITGLGAGMVGDTLLQWDAVYPLWPPLVGLGTLLEVVSYPPMLVSAIGVAHSRWGRRNTDLLIDTVTAIVASGMVYLQLADGHAGSPQTASVIGQIWPMTLMLLVSAILFLAVRIMFADRGSSPHSLVLLLVAAAFALGGSVQLMIVSPGALTGDRWVYTLWLTGAALVSLAATHPSMARLAAGKADVSERALTPVRFVALVGSLATSPALLVLHLALGDQPNLFSLAIGSTLLLPLVSLRVVRAVMTQRRSDERLERLVENSLDGICVLDADGTIRFLAGGPWLGTTPGTRPTRLEDLVQEEAGPAIREAVGQVLADPGSPRRLRLPATVGATTGCLEILLSNRTADPSIRGLVVNMRDVTEQQRVEAELNRRAVRDGLTGLGNREYLLERLASTRRSNAERGTWTGVLFLDLGRFKLVNDSLGHDIGDRLLQAVADRLRHLVRPQDVVTRFGGDEFVAVCPDLPPTPDPAAVVEGLARRLAGAFASPFDVGGRSLVVDGSVGVTLTGPYDRRSDEEVLRDADTAMYQAKTQGGSVITMFDEELRKAAVERLETELALRRGIEAGEIVVHFQPIVSLTSGGVVGHEALARWAHPSHGVLTPGSFMAAAEASGLIIPLGQQVLAASMQRYGAGGLGEGLELAVNLSPAELARLDVVEVVDRLAREHGMPLCGLTVEVTEAAIVEPDAVQVQALRALKERGVRIALDDFGTGYSSLAYLRRFPVDVLKIDRSFVSGIGRHAADEAVVEAILGLASALGLRTVAEGVETREQASWLRDAGCDTAQGYLYGRPLPEPVVDATVVGAR